jgi:hypothetical protein
MAPGPQVVANSGPQLHDSLTKVAAYLDQHCGIHP